ncbi:uncharacterized protein METZ01_LOCUS285002, partial [marine metagenome]
PSLPPQSPLFSRHDSRLCDRQRFVVGDRLLYGTGGQSRDARHL